MNKKILEIIESFRKQSRNFTQVLDIDLAMNMKVKQENIRGFILVPHGHGKTRVVIFLDKESDIPAENILDIDKLNKRKIEFDWCLATTGSFKKLLKASKTLGARKLLPNKKDGTLFDNDSQLLEALKDVQSNRYRKYKNDSAGHIRMKIGSMHLTNAQLAENLSTIINHIKTNHKQNIKKNYH